MRQYSIPKILGVWAAAALPMGLIAWVVVPALADPGDPAGRSRFAVALLVGYTIGLFWQFLLVVLLVRREGGSVRDRLWLHRPHWWVTLGVLAGTAVLEFLPVHLDGPDSRAMGPFLESPAGHELFQGNWPLFALCLVQFTLNTVLGEELLFRGVLLPRMNGAFGRFDWVVNALLFGAYHLHQPWSMPGAAATGALQAWAVKRYRSAWISIIAHSAQSVLLSVLILRLVV
ncbi:type II CAAX endopeptidase family protein [Dactylosporangium sp. NPDC005572]|uniref:CPBP family intramembrane glutamic endopeptidase n=1 Tax=Dactylosporangium sp. NPDC005572 TaxID=3156889 RepID=UPI0033A55F3C